MPLTKLSVNVNNIQALSDRPNTSDGLTSAELKAKFDKAGADIKDYLNTTLTTEVDSLVSSINSSLATAGGDITDIQNAMLSFNQIYPVGSIYMSINDTNPSTLFGGTWERIKDTFLLASGDTYRNGDTGGEATHTLTNDEIPSHKHSISHVMGYYNNGGTARSAPKVSWSQTNNGQTPVANNTTNNTGGGQAHNNMPPYLAVYMWKRVS